MSKIWKIGLWILVVAAMASTLACSGWLSRWRREYPDPPAGVFPPRVSRWSLEQKWEKNPSCIREEHLSCLAFYTDSGDDPDLTRVTYIADIFESPDQATARLESFAQERIGDEQDLSWEDGGPKIGRLLSKSNFRHDGEGIIGHCALAYTKGSTFININHGFTCENAREFLKDLTAKTE